MGQKDLTEKNLEFYPDVFADIFNALLYHGKQVVSPMELQSAPTETLYTRRNGQLHNQFHDVSKYVMRNGKIEMQYTLENETKAKRKTVLRKAGYEGAVYREQYDKPENYPIISGILYWGKGHWQQPRSLLHLWEEKKIPDEVKEYIDDIKIFVFDMRYLSKEVRNLFKSDMRIVVDYLAEGENYVPTDQKIVHLEALLLMLKALTGDNRYEILIPDMKNLESEEGGITMCELLDKYEKRGKAEGREEGREESIRNLMETMKWTAEQAMSALKIPDDERANYLARL